MHQGTWRWCSIVVVVIGLSGAPRVAAARGAAGSCGCADVNDLINRIAMAHAAQEKFRAEIPAIEKAAKTTTVNYDSMKPGSSNTTHEPLFISLKESESSRRSVLTWISLPERTTL